MNERLVCLPLAFQGEQDADGVMGVYIPDDVGFLLKGISHFVTFTGTPTSQTIDIQDDTVDLTDAIAIDISTNGYTELSTPAQIAGGSVIEVDLNLAGGSTTTATGEIGLWGFIDDK